MKKKINIINFIWSIILSLCLIEGYSLERSGEIALGGYVPVVGLLLAILIYLVTDGVWMWLDQHKSTGVTDICDDTHNIWLISFAIIWVCYFVVFLGVYPGFFVYDAQYELMETISREFNNLQPIFHVLYMGGIIQGVHKFTGDYNIAIAVFILCQMTFIAAVEGYLVSFLSNRTLSRRGAVVLSLYLGLFPVLAMYALCSAKDGVFGAFLILVFIQLQSYIEKPLEYVSLRKNRVILIASSVGMMLMRSNGVYAYIVFAAIAIIFARKMEGFYKLLRLMIVSVILFFIINKGLLTAVDAENYGSREMLTVPIQQMARLYSYDKDALTANEQEGILTYLPEEAIARYNPKCSDMVKIDFNEEAFAANKWDFVKLWLELGIKHPIAYINAWAMTSYGLWYPGALIDGYAGNEVFTFTYGESSYFGYETELPGVRDSKIPIIDSFYRWLSLDPAIQKIPFISLIFSPGFMLWVMLGIITYRIYKKRAITTLPYLLPILVICTAMLGPISLVRYSYYLWILVPVALLL